MDRHRRQLCEHCGESLSYSAYLSHRRLYYNSLEDRWLPSQQAAAPHQAEEVVVEDISQQFLYNVAT